MEKRLSNYELLRIISMFFIFIGHFMNQGNYFSNVGGGVNLYLGLLLGGASRIFVNVFLLIGTWFMVDCNFSGRRVLKLYFNIWTYTSILAIVVLLLGLHPEPKYVLTGIFPFVGKNLWFVSTYIALLLLSPNLQKVLQLKQNDLKKLVIILFFLISGFATVWDVKGIDDGWLNGLVWFVFVYIAIGYYKKYHFQHHFNKIYLLLLGLAMYMTLVYLPRAPLIRNTGIANMIMKLCSAFLADYKSIPNLIIAFCIFEFFRQLDIGSNKYINYYASGCLATYVIHQTHAFTKVLWYKILKCDYFFKTSYALVYCVFATCFIYTICFVLERIRVRFIEPLMLNNHFSKWLQCKIDGLSGTED